MRLDFEKSPCISVAICELLLALLSWVEQIVQAGRYVLFPSMHFLASPDLSCLATPGLDGHRMYR
jgi:hypothetical protein